MATVERLLIDSEVLGVPTFSLGSPDTADDLEAALAMVDATEDSSYVVCKLPMDRLELIHRAQTLGFVLLETQLRTVLRLKTAPVQEHPQYEYVPVTSTAMLDEVLEIAGQTTEHDRFSRDPAVGRAISGARYRRYLEQSFHAPDEEIWSVRSRKTGALLTFRSHRLVSPTEVLLLNGGVHPDHKGVGLGVVSSHFCFRQLRSSGITRAVSHISAANAPIINLEVGYCTFRVSEAFAVLRRSR